MKLLEVHCCPLWEEPDGTRRIGMTPADDHPPVVGWVNVLRIQLADEQHDLLWSGES